MILNKKDYVDKAQKVMDKLQKDKSFDLTTTKIRGLLAMTMDIYNEIMPLTEDELSESEGCKKICGGSTDYTVY